MDLPAVIWEQAAFSVLFVAVFVRDLLANLDDRLRTLSNAVAILGAVLLMVHSILQPSGIMFMALVAVLFVTALLTHLFTSPLLRRVTQP